MAHTVAEHEEAPSGGSQVLRERVRHTLARLSRTGELPSLPSVTTAALAVARDPDADMEQLCRVIQTDVGIAARVLRVANSAVYGRRTPCRTLRDALTTVGLRTTCDILMAASLRSLYDAKHPLSQVLWDHALAVALAAEEIAKVARSGERGAGFLPGLFHDVGRIVFLLTDPQPLDVIAGLALESATPRTQLEEEWYGFDHAAAGSTLAEDWGLPGDACDAIRWHHDPSSSGPGRPLAELLHVADRVAYAIGLGAGHEGPPPAAELQLRLTAEDEAAIAERTHDVFHQQKSIFE